MSIEQGLKDAHKAACQGTRAINEMITRRRFSPSHASQVVENFQKLIDGMQVLIDENSRPE